jgi:hypothetical protein
VKISRSAKVLLKSSIDDQNLQLDSLGLLAELTEDFDNKHLNFYSEIVPLVVEKLIKYN